MKAKGSLILLLLLLAGGGCCSPKPLPSSSSPEVRRAEPIVFELQALLAEGVPRVVLTDDRKPS